MKDVQVIEDDLNFEVLQSVEMFGDNNSMMAACGCSTSSTCSCTSTSTSCTFDMEA
jgi:hypothetical protein